MEVENKLKKSVAKKWLFKISIVFNIIFILGWLLNFVNSPTYKMGILTQDINAGLFSSDSVFIKIPKGTIVRNISQQGISAIGQFENNRFEIVFTSDRDNLVNYNIATDSINQFGNFYSADNNLYSE